jgi:fructose-bisphosphate aldolase class 1
MEMKKDKSKHATMDEVLEFELKALCQKMNKYNYVLTKTNSLELMVLGDVSGGQLCPSKIKASNIYKPN